MLLYNVYVLLCLLRFSFNRPSPVGFKGVMFMLMALCGDGMVGSQVKWFIFMDSRVHVVSLTVVEPVGETG